jgi:hypothetical protein
MSVAGLKTGSFVEIPFSGKFQKSKSFFLPAFRLADTSLKTEDGHAGIQGH